MSITHICLVDIASAVQIEALGSASAEGGANCVVTVKHMQKPSDKHAAALSVSMALEWKSVLTPLFFRLKRQALPALRAVSEAQLRFC